ncbi:MAG: helix-turn-helix domain-containing protein [Thermodesulfobacteriota bacterium]
MSKLLIVTVAARRLGVTDNYVRRLARQGKLDYVRESPRKTFILEDSLKAFQAGRETDV